MNKTAFSASLSAAVSVNALVTIAGVCMLTGNAVAQPLPCKVIRVINPSAPGGNSDIVFRLFAGKMGEILGQQLVLDYRPGAGGTIEIGRAHV